MKKVNCVFEKLDGARLDVNAIAKGFGVDLIAEYLDAKGIQNYLVEIGGEVVAKGINDTKHPWRVGIDQPKIKLADRSVDRVVELSGKAMASSGNYRNFHEIEGMFVGHTINPLTGYPELNSLLAVSVIAENCIYADAIATGFMAMGYEAALKIANERIDIDAYFILLENGKLTSSYSDGFELYF